MKYAGLRQQNISCAVSYEFLNRVVIQADVIFRRVCELVNLCMLPHFANSLLIHFTRPC